MPTTARLGEEGGEGIVADLLVGRHSAIWLNAVLEAVQLPAGIADLNTRLSDVDRDHFAHDGEGEDVGLL